MGNIEIFAVLVGQTQPKKLMEVAFMVNGQQAEQLIRTMDSQLYLFWNADTRIYDPSIGIS